jgi:hypothetical protein
MLFPLEPLPIVSYARSEQWVKYVLPQFAPHCPVLRQGAMNAQLAVERENGSYGTV